MDPTNIVENTVWIWFCPQMDRRTDGQVAKVKTVKMDFHCKVKQKGTWFCPQTERQDERSVTREEILDKQSHQ